MDYSVIKILQIKQRIPDSEMADTLGITTPGYIKMIKNKTCSVIYLEKLAKKFRVPISYFFENEYLYPKDNFLGKYNICSNPDCIAEKEELTRTIEELKYDKHIFKELLEIHDKKKN